MVDTVSTSGVGGARRRASDVQGLDAEPVGQTEINGQRVSVSLLPDHGAPAPAANHLDDDQKAKVKQALTPLRERRIRQATRERAVGGAALGSAIGAVVGTFLIPLPGIGTAVGAGLGALLGGAGGGGFGHLVAGLQAREITLESLVREVAPGSKTFDALARGAGVEPGLLSEESGQRISETLSRIVSGMAERGHPLSPGLVERVQTALIKLEGERGLAEDARKRVRDALPRILSGMAGHGKPLTTGMVEGVQTALISLEGRCDLTAEQRRDVRDRLSKGLSEWTAKGRKIDASMIERAVENLVRARQEMPPWIDDSRFVTTEQRGRVVEAIDAMMLERARRKVEHEAPDLMPVATDAFRQVATKDLDVGVEQLATAQLHDLMTGDGAVLGGRTLEAIAVAQVAIGHTWLDTNGRKAAMQALKAAIDERLRWGRPVDVAFVETAEHACIDAEQALRDHDPRLDPLRATYQAVVTSAIRNGDPLTEEARGALRKSLEAIQASTLPDDGRAAAQQTFEGAVDARLHLKKTIDPGFVRQSTDAALLAEAVLAHARLDQETGIPPESIAAIRQAYRQIVSARLQVGRPMSRQELADTLGPLKAGMKWQIPASDEEVKRLDAQVDQAVKLLVVALFKKPPSEDDLVRALHRTCAASVRYLLARGARGSRRRLDGTEIGRDLHGRFAMEIGLWRDRDGAFGRLMGDSGAGRALLVAADMLGSSHALGRQNLDGGLASPELHGAVLAKAIARIEWWCWHVERPGADIERLHEVTARAFDPDTRARAFLRDRMPDTIRGTRNQESWLRAEDARRTQARDPEYMAIKQARPDPDAPRLHDHDWEELKLGRDGGALKRAKDAFLDDWPSAYAELFCLRHLAERGSG
jgi:hypothetical protein